MQVHQSSIKSLEEAHAQAFDFEPTLIMLFVSPLFEESEKLVKHFSEKFPSCIIAGCSTSGEISDVNVNDATVSFTAVRFEKTAIKLETVAINEYVDSHAAGKELRQKLQGEELKHILVFSDGLHVNGAGLVEGLADGESNKVSITGGLAGDGSDFNQTFVIHNDKISDKIIVGVGLYGEDLKIGFGSKGGWDSFGIERQVTNSKGNVLFELDGEPALSLYKSFLGGKASELPSSGLLFPLSLRSDEGEPVVRTILNVDEDEQSLTFAGNIPQGSYVRLMKANIDRLITGAESSAKSTNEVMGEDAQLSILISCVGRRLVLKQLVEEEVEAVKSVVGDQSAITGFYSYGELAPFGKYLPCQLHNQTMTITTFSE